MIIRLLSIILNQLFHFLQFKNYITCRINKPALPKIAGHYFYITINQQFKRYLSRIRQMAFSSTRGKLLQINTKNNASKFYNKKNFRIQPHEAISLVCLLKRLSVAKSISLMTDFRIRMSNEILVLLIFQPFTVRKNKDTFVWVNNIDRQFIHTLKRKVLINEEVGNLVLIPITKAMN